MREERTLYQKVVLVILAAMIVVFAGVTAFNQSRKGILFEDAILYRQEVTDADCFAGKVMGEEVTLLCWYGDGSGVKEFTLRVGDHIHDTYTVYLGEPMIPLKGMTSGVRPEVPTLRITKNDRVIFDGGCRKDFGTFYFYTPDGEWTAIGLMDVFVQTGKSFWEDYTMDERLLVQLALEPELIDRGDWRLYGIMVFFTLLTMMDVAFPQTLFRWRHRRWVKDPEPTDDYMSVQHLAWLISMPGLLGFYIWTSMTLTNVV